MRLHFVGVACVALLALGQMGLRCGTKAVCLFPLLHRMGTTPSTASLQQQAEMLKELGDHGVGHVGPLVSIAERLKTLDAPRSQVVSDHHGCRPHSGQAAPTIPSSRTSWCWLPGRHVQFDVIVNGGKPSPRLSRPTGGGDRCHHVRPGPRFAPICSSTRTPAVG